MIDHITTITPYRARYSVHYVYYKSGRRVTYNSDNGLPISVLKFIINSNTYEVKYTDTGKVETCKNV